MFCHLTLIELFINICRVVDSEWCVCANERPQTIFLNGIWPNRYFSHIVSFIFNSLSPHPHAFNIYTNNLYLCFDGFFPN